jgi:3-phosphoshikimate 1-carboxyvinyltransferase
VPDPILMTTSPPRPKDFAADGPLRGSAAVPGDKSISHRALMLAAMARGESRIESLSDGEDVGATIHALRALGVPIEQSGTTWHVRGVGIGGLRQPSAALDLGNSGTSARLLTGLLATHDLTVTLTGDASLCRRPMDRVITPLRRLGTDFVAAQRDRLPLTLRGLAPAAPLTHRLTVASAQVKSALLLAGLNTPGITEVIEPVPTRDHTERMLARFGAEITVADGKIRLRGEPDLRAQSLRIPADPSAAAFLLFAALIVPGSSVRVEAVGVNPMRMGLFRALRRMGADLRLQNERKVDGEPVADLVARHSRLHAVDIPAALVPAMIDEFPIFFVAAAFAEGTSRAAGLAELRFKESDRLSAMVAGLRAIGADARETGNTIEITGSGGRPLPGGAHIDPGLDHRIAMSFAVAGLGCTEPVTVADMTPVSSSFPGFAAALEALA